MKDSASVEHLRELLRYEPETGRLVWRERDRKLSGKVAGGVDRGHGYRRVRVGGRSELAHRIIMAIVNGYWPTDEVDHINGNRDDNRLCNLRLVSRSGNMLNKSKYRNNSSGVTGVFWHRQHRKWCATVRQGKKHKHVGLFRCIGAAAIARHLAESANGYHSNHGRS